MPYSRPAIHLGDLARALEALEPSDEETQLAIAATLGMHWGAPQTRKPSSRRKTARTADAPHRTKSRPRVEPSKPPGRVLLSRLEHTGTEETAPHIYVPPLESSASEDEAQPPPLVPLLVARWTRAILSAALATSSEFGPVDVDRVVETLANGDSLTEFPMLSSPTLSRGVQLLIDRSHAMLPFIGDQTLLHKEILRVVGKDRVTTLRFVGCPARGAGAGPQMNWSRYEPPMQGTPIMLLTDLGIGRPSLSDERAGVAEWLEFALSVEKARCPMVAFVPYAESRWPQVLARHMTIIKWDRKTTATMVSSRVKGARGTRR